MKSKDSRTITLGTAETLLRQRATDTTTAKTGGNDKHSHDRPLWLKEFRFGHIGANIRDSANDLTFHFNDNDFSNIGKRGHVSDLCPKRRPIVVRVFELLKGQLSQSIDLR